MRWLWGKETRNSRTSSSTQNPPHTNTPPPAYLCLDAKVRGGDLPRVEGVLQYLERVPKLGRGDEVRDCLGAAVLLREVRRDSLHQGRVARQEGQQALRLQHRQQRRAGRGPPRLLQAAERRSEGRSADARALRRGSGRRLGVGPGGRGPSGGWCACKCPLQARHGRANLRQRHLGPEEEVGLGWGLGLEPDHQPIWPLDLRHV